MADFKDSVQKDINEVVLVGRIANDLELTTTPNGVNQLRFTLANNDDYKDSNSGNVTKVTNWINCTVFGKLAETMAKYQVKGNRILVIGTLNARSSQNEQGEYKTYWSVTVTKVQFLESRSQSANNEAPVTQSYTNAVYKPYDTDEEIF